MTGVLVTGSTGRIGKELVARLGKASGIKAICALHTPSKGEYLTKLGASELRKFDYNDEKTWAPALEGVSTVFSSSLDPLLEGHMKFAEYLGKLPKGQIKQVVRISCMGADTNTATYDYKMHVSRDNAEIPLMLQHYWWGEECLLKAGLPTTVLRNNFFMNHLLKTETDSIDTKGTFSNPLGRTRNAFVSTTDIAEAAAVCIIEGAVDPKKHENKFYDLCGPAPQNMDEIAADLSKAMGKDIKYIAQDMKQFEIDFGPTRAGFFEYLCNGFYSRSSPDFYNITGHRPMTYYEYLTIPGPSGETGLDELYQGGLWSKGKDAMAEAAKAAKK